MSKLLHCHNCSCALNLLLVCFSPADGVLLMTMWSPDCTCCLFTCMCVRSAGIFSLFFRLSTISALRFFFHAPYISRSRFPCYSPARTIHTPASSASVTSGGT
ncbi:unnamed protein product, partial [Pylaiella littoralis]